ncbi:hypothetical protein SynWH8103_00520 [Synechococcus sp. WH 8103]|nr:hypothetical protein SynWH8103_00520 [Synechococcus sp. WH 8103]
MSIRLFASLAPSSLASANQPLAADRIEAIDYGIVNHQGLIKAFQYLGATTIQSH